MPLRILDLPAPFRPGTSITYPPFKKGRYMEEYFYDYVMKHCDTIESDRVYVPIFWTNLQNHPGFAKQKQNYETLLLMYMKKMPLNTKYFTVVQHDDGPQLKMMGDVLIFGACSGDIPLPLLYEDTNQTLMTRQKECSSDSKTYLASFVGTLTHPIRREMKDRMEDKKDVCMGVQGMWTSNVPMNLSELFVEKTLDSKFCLAPRGYGRSSFRFFEAIQLQTIPVYLWDDKEWLPYQDILDYSTFSISIPKKDIPFLYDILGSISNETYENMRNELKKIQKYMTLDFMCEYIVSRITK